MMIKPDLNVILKLKISYFSLNLLKRMNDIIEIHIDCQTSLKLKAALLCFVFHIATEYNAPFYKTNLKYNLNIVQ